jgi:hypothetical protein
MRVAQRCECACLRCCRDCMQVRYTCARDTKENVVVSVKEFPTCNYVVVVSTPFLCKHPAFLPPVSAVAASGAPPFLPQQSCRAVGAASSPRSGLGRLTFYLGAIAQSLSLKHGLPWHAVLGTQELQEPQLWAH